MNLNTETGGKNIENKDLRFEAWIFNDAFRSKIDVVKEKGSVC